MPYDEWGDQERERRIKYNINDEDEWSGFRRKGEKGYEYQQELLEKFAKEQEDLAAERGTTLLEEELEDMLDEEEYEADPDPRKMKSMYSKEMARDFKRYHGTK
jgi:hypothetical protein